MPTYVYECGSCGERFEVFQKMTDPYLKGCPRCEGQVRRLIGAGSGLIFKGPGFYATDYRSESYKAKEKENQKEKPSEARGAKEDQPEARWKDKEGPRCRPTREEDE